MENEHCELPKALSSDEDSLDILARYKKIAVVGVSSRPEKPSHFVSKYLKDQGYRIFPVNPMAQGPIFGEAVYARIKDISETIDVVCIFRPSKDIPPLVEEAIKVGAKAIWMQEGIVNEQAAERARSAGLKVIMNRCMMKVHKIRS